MIPSHLSCEHVTFYIQDSGVSNMLMASKSDVYMGVIGRPNLAIYLKNGRQIKKYLIKFLKNLNSIIHADIMKHIRAKPSALVEGITLLQKIKNCAS